MKLTENILKATEQYQDWIIGNVVLTQEIGNNVWLVIHSNNDKWTVTRFFLCNGELQVSQDRDNVTEVEVFKTLLNQYK